MWRVQLYKLNYDEREYQAVKDVLNSGWLCISEKTQAFEAAFSELLGHDTKCLAVSSGTAALHMALLACGIGKGSERCSVEVITPALTFIADQNVVEMTGAKNVLADITSMDDWSMDPDDIEARITPKTKAIMIVHYAGFACDMERISAICKKHGLILIEDCAHTPGAEYIFSQTESCQTESCQTGGYQTGGLQTCGLTTPKKQPLGTFGDVSAFSFFANKNIAVGEGGMVVTRNAEIFKKLKQLRSHGMSVPSFDRYKGRAISYDVESPGLNYRITEICSALGLVQLDKLQNSNEKRKNLVNYYYKRLDSVSDVSIPYRFFSRGEPNYHIMPILLSDSIDRKAVIESMKQDGVQTSIHYPAVQEFSAYKDNINPTPKAEYVCAHELTLPLYPDMTIEEVDIVCDALINGLFIN